VSRRTVQFFAELHGIAWTISAVIDKGLAVLMSASRDGLMLDIATWTEIYAVPPIVLDKLAVEARERAFERDYLEQR
jgi:hypothetical protein